MTHQRCVYVFRIGDAEFYEVKLNKMVGSDMGMVAVTFRVMPEGPDADLNKIKKEVEKAIHNHKDVELKNATIKPIGFGLSALEILLVMPDSGGTDKIEQEILKISGVESIEAGDVTLL